MLIIILYVLIIILYVDFKCLLYQKSHIDKNGNNTYIKSYYCNNAFLILNYKSKGSHLLHIQFPLALCSTPS